MATRVVDVQGHRGAGDLTSHNTLEAVRLAANIGLSSVEFDVWRLGCGKLIVAHGKEVLQEGEIGFDGKTWDEVSTSDESSVELFEDFIDTCMETGLKMNVDIKTSIPCERVAQHTAGSVIQVLRQKDALSIASISSFQRGVIDHAIQIEPNISVGMLYDPWAVYSNQERDAETQPLDPDFASWFRPGGHPSQGVDTVNLCAEALEPHHVEEVKRNGKEVLVWFSSVPQKVGFSEGPEEYERLIQMGVKTICCNRPDLLLKYLEDRQSAQSPRIIN